MGTGETEETCGVTGSRVLRTEELQCSRGFQLCVPEIQHWIKTTPKPNSLKQQPFILLRHKQFGQSLAGMACSCSMEHQLGQLTEGWGTLFPDDSLTRPAPCCWWSLGLSWGWGVGALRFCPGGPLHVPGCPHSTMVYFKGERRKRETQAEAVCLLWPNLGCHPCFSVFCSLKLAQRLTCSRGGDIDFTS